MKHLLMLCSNDSLKHLFLSNMFSTICKRNKDLEQILEQGKYPNKKKLSLLTSRSKNYIYIYIYIYYILLLKIFAVITALECSMGRAIY